MNNQFKRVRPIPITDIAKTDGGKSYGPIYFKDLDGLRFLCFLAVFFFHGFYRDRAELKASGIYQFIKFDIFGNGNLGVNFFFVLSGFLITYLLIMEKQTFGRIDIRRFWLRRILRIWPLFYFCVLFGFVIFPLLKSFMGAVPNESADPILYVTFLNNFDLIGKGPPDASVLGVLWSIAVEEQFYLLWPLFMAFLPIKRLPLFFSLVLMITILFRASVIGSPDRYDLLELHTLSCIGDMTIGAIGAYLILAARGDRWIEKWPRWAIACLYCLLIGIFLFRDELLFQNKALHVFERSFIAFVILAVILEQNYARRSFFKTSNWRFVPYLGRISYGLYCVHFIGILFSITLYHQLGWNTELWQVLILEMITALGFTILFAIISYRYFERPFLKLKDRFTLLGKAKIEPVAVPTDMGRSSATIPVRTTQDA